MFLASLQAPEVGFSDYMKNYAQKLDDSRPTARNLKWAIDRVFRTLSKKSAVDEKRQAAYATACAIADEDARFCEKIGHHGVEIIKEISRKKDGAPVNILTHCNAGWLAFVDHGSATAPIYAARDAGIPLHVWVDETRPWNQGARLTAWELQQEGIDNTLICDNCGGHLMQHGMVDMVIVGTDRTTHTGDVANKIGTYLKALAAKDNNIPFYVALPSSTFDWDLDNGLEIPIEQRSGKEITTISGKDECDIIKTIELAAPETRAANYGFDVTPARLITGLITERGVVEAVKEDIHRLYPENKN
jgi:methylthioribose-1-phosphate isomerase